MRLTEKGTQMACGCAYELQDSNGIILDKHEPKKADIIVCQRYNKLVDIEDIEDKIGIEIVDFYKLTQADKIYLPRFKAYYKVTAIDVKTWEILVYNNRKIPCAYSLKIKNYGKTWLFKKGAENE